MARSKGSARSWVAVADRPAGPPNLRTVGIDLGTRRIGVALSNSEGTLAVPYDVVVRSGDRRQDHRRIAALVAEAEATRVVVGLPLSLDGTAGPAAQAAMDETAELAGALAVPVESYDERFTTVTADRALQSAKMNASARRKVIDKVAAAVMLQAWLDRQAEREAQGRQA